MTMLPESLEKLSNLKVGTAATDVKVLSEPYVRYTDWGYVAVLHVQVLKSGIDYLLPISARSLAKALRKLQEEDGNLIGLQFRLKKTGEDKTSTYELEKSHPKRD
jgi:hypothetical protein